MRKCYFIYLLFLFVSCQKENPADLYDQETKQKAIYTHKGVDSALSLLEQVPFHKLPKAYRKKANFQAYPNKNYPKRNFYIVPGNKVYAFIAGRTRLHHLLPKDETYQRVISNQTKEEQILCINPSVIHKLLDLYLEMERINLDPKAIKVISGFRHPHENNRVKGARGSRHLIGDALDIKVGDVDKNGKIEKEDKWKVYKILNEKVIGNTSGIGRYPKSQVLHFDVRGYGARWDSYTR